MPRGNGYRGGRGGRGGGNDGGFRGRGWGRGGRGRGGGRGGFGRGGGAGPQVVLHNDQEISTEIDFVIQKWPAENATPSYRGGKGTPNGASTSSRGWGRPGTPRGGFDSPRGRGRGRGDFDYGNRSRGRGRGQGWGRGRGFGGATPQIIGPLSELLFAERPLLRPVIFVKSAETPYLFMEKEDIFKPGVEETGDGEQDHVPTAERVARVFSGRPVPPAGFDQEEGEEELEEIDFSEIGRIQAEVDAAAALAPKGVTSTSLDEVEERFTGIRIRSTTQQVVSFKVADGSPPAGPSLQDPTDDTPLFVIDTTPAPVLDGGSNSVLVNTHPSDTPLGELADDDDLIVYDAPNPRSTTTTAAPSGRQTPEAGIPVTTSLITEPTISLPEHVPPSQEDPAELQASVSATVPETPAAPTTFASVHFSFKDSPSAKRTPQRVTMFTAGSSARSKLRARVTQRQASRKKRGTFGSFGAMMEEAHIRGEDVKDPRWEERRRDDSDIDWGDEDEEQGGGASPPAAGSSRAHLFAAEGMDIDPELDPNFAALVSFAKGMAPQGDAFVTMDDIADQKKMEEEDAHVDERASSGESNGASDDDGEDEVDAAINAEEEQMLGEEESDAEYDESFDAQLKRIRKAAEGKRKAANPDDDSEDDSEDDYDDLFMTKADEDEEFLDQLDMLMDQNQHLLKGKDRKQRNALFRSIHHGEFLDQEDYNLTNKQRQEQVKDLGPELLDQWEKDRAKKAENKRKRAEARLLLAADPLAPKKGGKKGHKAMLAAARLDPTINVIPNRIIDTTTLVQQIRRFIADVGGPNTMSLPPADKATRKNVHDLATAFNLKSASKGKGDARYTTLTKTTRSGLGVNEKKVGHILRRGTSRGYEFVDGGRGDGRRGGGGPPIHREGAVVGEAAPKINESNKGFRMLESMGWTEGERIGLSGGLDVPLVAIMKKSKLGLGATKEDRK
ncbi:hypothetical protein BDN72DRAFT_800797 [Pluteus cervinus]|uniref:Uncharacterized protein n=1 Tax=Pluteus cervinus TaxID=181527 RepID=A0ACD3AJW6_9AGAR|nr:hypothetical protein BDN72DRAFT_800797 [Pluteus cervinus]